MAETIQNHDIADDFDQDFQPEPSTPGTPVSAAVSPRKQSKTRDKTFLCPYEGCLKAFNRPARLEEHKRSHLNERIFKCPHPGCTKDFLRKTHLKRHIEANHTEGPKTYLCQYEGCGQSFVTNQRLKRHHGVHEKRDRYRCTEPGCDETFRKHGTLDQHVRTVHQGQAAFPCDETLVDGTQCQRGFGNAHYLKLHKGRDHGAKSYFCTICPEGSDSSFGTFSDLQAHNKIVHPPSCETCGYQGKTTKDLSNHIQNKHSGDTLALRQTHVCPFPECGGQGFVEKKNLKTHIRTIHENHKPFQCGDLSLNLNHVEGWDIATACGRAFSHKATLENHIRSIHMGLESMQAQRLKRKADNGDTKQPKKRTKVSKLDLLTGTGMTADTRRTISCPIYGCDFMFMREWDKVVHLQARHGVFDDDNWIMTANDSEHGFDDEGDDHDFGMVAQLTDTRPVEHDLVQYTSVEEELEALANKGGQFWIGGIDEANVPHYSPFHNDFETLLEESEEEDHGTKEIASTRNRKKRKVSPALDPELS